MEHEFLQFITQDGVHTNVGPNAKEILLHQAESEYCNGATQRSIFYQVAALYQCSQDRYYQATGDGKSASVDDYMNAVNKEEAKEFNNNCLIEYISKALKTSPIVEINNNAVPAPDCNFLKGITDPDQGIQKLESICKQMPKEWTILQLCKGPRQETTFSIFPKIHESDAAIYFTLLKHARSDKYPTPICLRFSGVGQKDLYENFANVVKRFKQYVNVDPKEWHTREVKKIYWQLMGELNQYMTTTCADLKNFFYPWTFLFSGLTCSSKTIAVWRKRWIKVDAFCDRYCWKAGDRILLSLAASHVTHLSVLEIEAICDILADSKKEKNLTCNLLSDIQQQAMGDADADARDGDGVGTAGSCYPCILVIDERLDHFFWEEMNVFQEFSRVNSLQCLWRLYNHYKEKIHKGYLNVEIIQGAYVINPDKNLPKMELRMRSFCEYWLPHWMGVIGQKPTQDEFKTKIFNSSCYVYSGHGSSLQYINGRNIAKMEMNCVVFLFGCDSSRLHSNGLYSELVGPHLYYHAAMCPALVGTIMPCLDSNMDKVATEILSRWIAPKSKKVLPWNTIEPNAWIKEGIIKSSSTPSSPSPSTSASVAATATMATTPNYHMGSLCSILAKVHQRISEPKLYNTAPYVCRGLPVWNCHVEPLPKT